jgi:hypothetical protein
LSKDVDYTINPEGKVANLNVPLINKTEYPIESITIKVNYINPGNNTMETRNFEVKMCCQETEQVTQVLRVM